MEDDPCQDCGFTDRDLPIHIRPYSWAKRIIFHDLDETSRSARRDRHLAHLERKIKDTIRSLKSLRRERSELRQKADDHIARVADSHPPPIHNLPVEVLSIIFEFAYLTQRQEACLFQKQETVRWNNSLDTVSPPWCLGRVCHKWREIVLSYHRMWSHVSLPKFSNPEKNDDQIFKSHLRRSGDHPLSIYLFWDSDEDHRPQNHDLVKRIVSHSWRLTTLEIEFGPEYVGGTDALSGLEESLPSLEVLRLYADRDADIGDITLHLDMFSIAPRLREVCIERIAEVTARIELPWSQITRYVGIAYVFKELFQVLAETPNLEECDLRHDYGEVVGANLHTPVNNPLHLPKLRRLAIDGENMLDGLFLPALEDLTIRPCSDDFHHLCQFIVRSGCALRKLRIRLAWESDYKVPTTTFIQLLPYMPSITYLRVTEVVDPKDERPNGWFLDALAISSPPLLPNSDHLHIDIKASPDAIHRLLPPIFDARWSNVSPHMKRLRKLDFHVIWHSRDDYSLHKDTKSRFERCQDEGLELNFEIEKWFSEDS